MHCDHYDFGAEEARYNLTNHGKRNAVMFYARPPTQRRAWELGVLALTLFAQQHPDVEIHMVGWPLRGFKAPFEYVDHGILRLDQLNELYNKMAGGLVLSLTNCSLLPLELLAAGVIPVVNDAPNNRMVVDNPNVRFCEPSPHALARALGDVVSTINGQEQAARAAGSVSGNRWETACERVENVLLGALRA
jgi:glycosyltransferase involved in cell wall biosynthesis